MADKILSESEKQSMGVSELESYYHSLFSTLNTRLDELVYLKKLNSLESSTNEDINIQYSEIRNSVPEIPSQPVHESTEESSDATSRLQSLSDFLRLQTSVIKTNSLVVGYLQMILPVLKSIHIDSSDKPTTPDTDASPEGVSTSDETLSKNLEKLYSTTSSTGIFKLMQAYRQFHGSTSRSLELNDEIKQFVSSVLKPKLLSLDTLSKLNVEKFKYLTSLQEKEIESAANSSSSGSEKFAYIKSQFQDIQDIWVNISLYADFLPGLILTTTPDSNWADDAKFTEIILESGEIAMALTNPRHISNINLAASSIEELLLLDLS